MSHSPSTFLGARPPRHRKRRDVFTPATPPGPPIAVVIVQTDDPPSAGQGRWQFDADVTLLVPVVGGLRVFVEGVWLEPLASYQLAEPFVVYCIYDTAAALDGCGWEIVAPPSGIEQAGRVVVPQGGTIVAP